jgi:hypothetical protein
MNMLTKSHGRYNIKPEELSKTSMVLAEYYKYIVTEMVNGDEMLWHQLVLIIPYCFYVMSDTAYKCMYLRWRFYAD